MPLPFSFSTQRQAAEAEMPSVATDVAVIEKIMGHSPGQISTEPLLGTPGNIFSPPVLESAAPQPKRDISPRLSTGLPPAPSPNQRFTDSPPPALSSSGTHSATLHLHPVTAQPQFHSGNDWNAQMEQLRNDLFGIAMSVSALNDRLDRLEQRVPSGASPVQASLATLRAEIESWLENHLNTAVEHCMQRIMSRPTHPASS
jgi:hypothetical protein